MISKNEIFAKAEMAGFKYVGGEEVGVEEYDSKWAGIAVIDDEVLQVFPFISGSTPSFCSYEIPFNMIKRVKITSSEVEVAFGNRGYCLIQR